MGFGKMFQNFDDYSVFNVFVDKSRAKSFATENCRKTSVRFLFRHCADIFRSFFSLYQPRSFIVRSYSISTKSELKKILWKSLISRGYSAYNFISPLAFSVEFSSVLRYTSKIFVYFIKSGFANSTYDRSSYFPPTTLLLFIINFSPLPQ